MSCEDKTYECAACSKSVNFNVLLDSKFRNDHDNDCMSLHNSVVPDLEPCNFVCDECFDENPCECYDEVFHVDYDYKRPSEHYNGATFYLINSAGHGYATKEDLVWYIGDDNKLLPYGTYLKFHEEGNHIQVVLPKK